MGVSPLYFQLTPCNFRTDRDVRGDQQQRVCRSKLVVEQRTRMYTVQQAISKRLTEIVFVKKIVHCNTVVEKTQRNGTDTDVRGSMQQRCFCGTKTRVQKCTRMYTSGQAISKRLTERSYLQRQLFTIILLSKMLNVSERTRYATCNFYIVATGFL